MGYTDLIIVCIGLAAFSVYCFDAVGWVTKIRAYAP